MLVRSKLLHARAAGAPLEPACLRVQPLERGQLFLAPKLRLLHGGFQHAEVSS